MDTTPIFESNFVKAFDCGSSSYKDVVALGNNRFCGFKLVNTTGSEITKNTTTQEGEISVNIWNSTGSDPEFVTDKHGTLARVDNYHLGSSGNRVTDAHSGDERFDNWQHGNTLGTLYLTGSVALASELNGLMKPK
ncbi:MAG: hypothetical protein Q7S55_02650 [Nanoarchaeota archaeon]|nr:hypothetical protein [Nanoarchaeota archaeon]